MALAAHERLGHDPRAGGLFPFVNRRANRLTILWFDPNGYGLRYKRLHQAVFVVPRATNGVAAQIDGGALARRDPTEC